MKQNPIKIHETQNNTLQELYKHHIDLKQTVLDMFRRAWDTNSIEPLMEIRSLNSACLSKYSDLIQSQQVIVENDYMGYKAPIFEAKKELNLWEINIQLSKMVLKYKQALSNPSLSGFVRMLISINLDKLVLLKDNILHPIPEVMSA